MKLFSTKTGTHHQVSLFRGFRNKGHQFLIILLHFDEAIFDEIIFDEIIFDEIIFDEIIFDETIFDETIFDQNSNAPPSVSFSRFPLQTSISFHFAPFHFPFKIIRFSQRRKLAKTITMFDAGNAV
jgi:hypothetical protein